MYSWNQYFLFVQSGLSPQTKTQGESAGWTLKSGHRGPTEGRGQSSVLTAKTASGQQGNKPASSVAAPPFGQQLSWGRSRRRWEEKKTAPSTVCPCASHTSPFCFSAAAGPDWLIASLIQFSRARLQRLSTFIRILYQRLLACGSKI